MKQIILAAALASLAACSPDSANHADSHERPPENGAQYKDREGVALTDTMKKSIGLQVTDVEEAKVTPEFTVPLHVIGAGSSIQPIASTNTSRSASGWLTALQAAQAQPGVRVVLKTSDRLVQGVVRSVEKSAYHVAGEFEVVVEPEEALEVGSRILATFRGEARDSAVAIPRVSLLKTAEGSFVYAVNGERFVRTPVKVGAENSERVEITDGLYSGDQIVSNGVMPLWLAELQVLRGGKACTCGH
jgi:hypothetical protein